MILRGDLLVGKDRKVDSILRMFHGDPADTPRLIQFEKGVLVEVSRLSDRDGAEFDVQGIRVQEVRDFHGLNDRSKNALCTVSPLPR